MELLICRFVLHSHESGLNNRLEPAFGQARSSAIGRGITDGNDAT
ncbi:hypothetical protein OHAE_2138 [Ochrobactrum soli]|uniref:Uncharacterized protein n=1 Tax=Ochrobactrum soli TaxID=2448455 RepID=A0A2P9HQA8_9HYPH|nr:hypothetical protein OHAE_2138 [[Ochrobactrum] soli]